MYIYIHIYVYMYIYIYMHSVHIYVYMLLCIHAVISLFQYQLLYVKRPFDNQFVVWLNWRYRNKQFLICNYAEICRYIYADVDLYICNSLCIYIYLYIYIHLGKEAAWGLACDHPHTSMCTQTLIYIYSLYIYINVCI